MNIFMVNSTFQCRRHSFNSGDSRHCWNRAIFVDARSLHKKWPRFHNCVQHGNWADVFGHTCSQRANCPSERMWSYSAYFSRQQSGSWIATSSVERERFIVSKIVGLPSLWGIGQDITQCERNFHRNCSWNVNSFSSGWFLGKSALLLYTTLNHLYS